MPAEPRPEPQFSFTEVHNAILSAIIENDRADLDRIISQDINSLAQVQRTRTTVFSAVDAALGDNGADTLSADNRPYLMDFVADTVGYIFDKAEKKMGSELAGELINATCNHISHTSMLPTGSTVRDIMEHYAGVSPDRAPKDKEYQRMFEVIKKLGLCTKSEVAQERLSNTTSSVTDKGRTL